MRRLGIAPNIRRSKHTQLEHRVSDLPLHKRKLHNTFSTLTFCFGLSAISALMPNTGTSAHAQQPSYSEFAKMDFKLAKDYCQSKTGSSPHIFLEICEYIRENDQLIVKRNSETAEKFKTQIEDRDLLFNEKIVNHMIELVEDEAVRFDISGPHFPQVEDRKSSFCSTGRNFDMAYHLARYIAYYTVYLRLLSYHKNTGNFDFHVRFNPTYIQTAFKENESNPLSSLTPGDFYKILQRPKLISKLRKLAIDKNIAAEIKTIIPILREFYAHYIETKTRLLKANEFDDFLIDIKKNGNFRNKHANLSRYAIFKPHPCYGQTSVTFRFVTATGKHKVKETSHVVRMDTDWYFFSFWLRRDMEGSTKSTLNVIEAAQNILDGKYKFR